MNCAGVLTLKILITDDISPLGIERLRQVEEAEVVIRLGITGDDLLHEIRDADALMVRSQTKVSADVIAAGEKLRVIGRAGVGVDNIDLAAATQRGVLVLNAPDGNTISAAEHTFAMLISMARHIPTANAKTKNGVWDRKSFVGVELRSKTLAVLGMGRIGTEVALRAKAFGMQVNGYDPFLTEERAQSLGITRMNVADAIASADFITVHTPLTKETRHLINAGAFSTMKSGVRLINCARGGIIDEAALLDALNAGIVAGAALDVFEVEPVAPDYPLLLHPNVVVTPHLGASTVEAQVNVAIDVAEEIARVLTGQTFRNAVNLPALSAEQKSAIEPYTDLAEKLGVFIAELGGAAPSQLEVTYLGDLAQRDVSFLTRTVVKGFFGYRYADEVNYVNALVYAEQSGLEIREVKQPKSKVFTNQIIVEVKTETGRHYVAGTLYNGFGPRIVEVDGYSMDAPIVGKMLFTRHTDKPGVIGHIGTLLGKAEVNIASMQVGRRESGGEAIMMLCVDKLVPEATVDAIARVPGILEVQSMEL